MQSPIIVFETDSFLVLPREALVVYCIVATWTQAESLMAPCNSLPADPTRAPSLISSGRDRSLIDACQ